MTSTPAAHEPPFVLDGSVTKAKLVELIEVQTELKWLDLKAECDLDNTPGRVELAKDAGAMQIAGGYLLVGVDDNGEVVGLPVDQVRLFDEAVVRDKLDKYLGTGYDVRSAVHTTETGDDPKEVAIVWVAPHPDGCNVFCANGDYTENGKPKSAFRAGDVYARHGSKSEPWNQADRAEANANRDRRAKERWRAEMAEEFSTALHAADTANTVTSEPSATYTWQLDAAGFEAATVELLRRDDDVPVKTMLRSAQAEVRRLVSAPVGRVGTLTAADAPVAADDLNTVLDRLITVAALALDLDRPRYFTMTCRAFAELYGWAVEEIWVQSSNHGLVPVLWLRIAERLYALGGLAVRLKNWAAVRDLALLDVDALDRDYGSRTWHRDALTQSSRANLFNVTQPDGRILRASLPSFARGIASRLPVLRPELPEFDDQVTSNDALLLSICSFDLLTAIVAAVDIAAATDRDVFDVSYPNFSRFGGPYDKVVTRLLADPTMRSALLESVSDADLARVLALEDQVASKEPEGFFGWDGYRDQAVKDFIVQHHP